MDESKPLLEIKNFSLFYSKEATLENINLSIQAGETVGILGESGSGKTSLFLSLLVLFSQDRARHTGSLNYCIQNENSINPYQISSKELYTFRKKHLSTVFQNAQTSLSPSLCIQKQIKMLLDKDKIEALMHFWENYCFEKTYIPEILKSYPHELSGGQCQKILVSIALISSKDLLLADEPFSAMDIHSLSLFKKAFLEERKKRKSTVLVISHDLHHLSAICDRILVLYSGQIMEDLPFKKILASSKHPYTQALVQAQARLRNTNKVHPPQNIPGVRRYMNKACSFSNRCEKAMRICHKEIPSLYVQDSHSCACWLEDPKRKTYLKDK